MLFVYAIAHGGERTHISESALKGWLWEKYTVLHRKKRTCVSSMQVVRSSNWATSPPSLTFNSLLPRSTRLGLQHLQNNFGTAPSQEALKRQQQERLSALDPSSEPEHSARLTHGSDAGKMSTMCIMVTKERTYFTAHSECMLSNGLLTTGPADMQSAIFSTSANEPIMLAVKDRQPSSDLSNILI